MNLQQLQGSQLNKKAVKLRGQQDALELLNEGNEDLTLVASQLAKMQEYLTEFNKVIKKNLVPDEAHGVKIELSHTGDRLNYEEDEVYSNLKAQLKERELLLKMSHKSKGIILEEDNETIVPKVGIKTHSAEVIKLTLK